VKPVKTFISAGKRVSTDKRYTERVERIMRFILFKTVDSFLHLAIYIYYFGSQAYSAISNVYKIRASVSN
jgi:hypothetical protein